jgi:two-component system osmolarity sensor histidine kinase EnvZ
VKRFLPKSLYGRAVAIVILPIFVMQIIVAYIFFDAHWDTVTARMSEGVAGEVALAVDLYRDDPTATRAQELDARFLKSSDLSIALERGDTLPVEARPALISALDGTLRRALERRLEDPFWFDTTRYPNHIDIRVSVEEGTLRFIAARERVFAPTGYAFVLLLIATTIGLTLISVIFLRNLAKPVIELAEAADAYGRGKDIDTYKPSGAREIRLAGQSFLKMRERINRFVEQRTAMLAGVSHDLRTPLQRLKLHLALSDDDTLEARQDLTEMEAMLSGYLDFAQSDTIEPAEPISLAALVTQVADSYGIEDVSIRTSGEVEIRPLALRRALGNLMGNAVKYAPDARVALLRDGDDYVINIDDNGPGIPDHLFDEALKPFSRLDAARSQNIEGTGLGLAIARDIARTHGGTVRLSQSEMGGLRAQLRLPV